MRLSSPKPLRRPGISGRDMNFNHCRRKAARRTSSRIAEWTLGGACSVFIACLVVTITVRAQPLAAGRPAQESTDKPTQAFRKICSDCHEPDRIVATRRSKSGWEEVVDKMVTKGAIGTDNEFDLVMQYLLVHYGTVNVNRAPAEEIVVVLSISQKDADAIVSYRKANGNFQDFDGLAKVPGIDTKPLALARDAITF